MPSHCAAGKTSLDGERVEEEEVVTGSLQVSRR